MLSTKWWVRFPGQASAMTFHFAQPVNETAARAKVREWAGVKRLPCLVELWRG